MKETMKREIIYKNMLKIYYLGKQVLQCCNKYSTYKNETKKKKNKRKKTRKRKRKRIWKMKNKKEKNILQNQFYEADNSF